MATETLIFQIDATPTVKALQDIGKEIEKNTDALKSYEKGTEAYIVQEASVKVLQKEQRALTNVLVQQKAAIDRVSDATVENIKVGKASENSIEQNRKAYNALYNQLIRTAKPTADQIAITKELNQVLKQQEAALGNTSRNVGNYAEGFKEAAKDLNLFGVNIGGLSKGLETAKDGFTAAGGGVKGFSAALATTGLPLIIMGVQALIGAFETFKPVADAVEDAVTGLAAAFKAFTTGGSMVDAYNQTKQYNDILRELEDTQKSFEVQQAKYELQIERLALQSKNRNRTEQERRNLIKQANDLEVQSFDERQKRNKEEIDNEANKFNILAKLNKADLIATLMGTKEEQKLFRERLEARGKFDEATFNKIQDLLLKRVSIERESISIREKLNNRDAALDDQITKEKEQELEKRRIAQEKRDAQEAERTSKFIKMKEDEAKALLKINEEYNNELAKQDEQRFNDTVKQMQNEAKMFEESQNAQAARLKAYQDAEKAKVDATKAAAQQNIQTQQAELQAASQISNAFIGLISQVAEASGAGAEFAKALGFIQILTNQAIAIGNAIVGATAAGAATGPAAPFTTPAFIATLIGSVTAVIGGAIGLLSQPVPKPAFATGVIGLDGAGTATSDSIDARLSRGESVITAKATERFAPVLAQMELAVGNRPNFQLGNRKFATGYIPTTDGGYSDRAMSSDVNKANDLAKMFSDTISKMPQPKLVYDEFTKFVDNRNQSVNLSEL
jgi:hypothetical protein